jgi:diacylglycerol kinase family enzyme
MNGRFYGGGMMAPPDQDRLNTQRTVTTMVMYGKGKIGTLAAFPSIFKGEHVNKTKIVKTFVSNRVKVAFDRPVALQIDGETVLNVREYEVITAE